jgi:glycosyltransferase involved in cell wall biosynthesis
VPYTRVDVALRAASDLGRDVVVVGEGPERRRLQAMAGPNVRFVGWLEGPALLRQYQSCRALLFPGEEDFGIVPLEAMACGRPVVALRAGGALETVVEGQTGVFFEPLEPAAMAEGMRRLEKGFWDPARIRRRALEFSRELYRQRMREEVERLLGDTDAGAGGVRDVPPERGAGSWATLKGASGKPGSSSSGT